MFAYKIYYADNFVIFNFCINIAYSAELLIAFVTVVKSIFTSLYTFISIFTAALFTILEII
jgi:hypothetical protein